MIKTSQALAPNEQFRLDQCEKTIERGLNTFVEVGRALTEIRDAKLYRIGFKTFEAYCKERWEISRPRAYSLMEQADVASAVQDAVGVLSPVGDISKRDAAVVKAELPAVTAEIKARVEKGEAPEVAVKEVIKETADRAKASKAAKQAENKASQEATLSALAPEIQQNIQARKDAVAAKKAAATTGDQDAADQIDALKQANDFLEKHVAELEAKLRTYERLELMYRDWTEGGWEQVVRAKDDTIAELQRTAQTRIARESSEKVSNLNAMRGLAKRLDEAGKRRDIYIDLDEANNG